MLQECFQDISLFLGQCQNEWKNASCMLALNWEMVTFKLLKFIF